MQRVDAHQHFWKYNPVRDSWITDDMSAIQQDFMPDDLWPVLDHNGFDSCVVVQSDQSEAENEFQLANAGRHHFIKGIVGWVDLQHENVEKRLQYYSGFQKIKGFRHLLQGEKNRSLMLQPAFKRGVGLLHKYNFTYDILIFPDQLGYTTELVQLFPEQKFVIDHIAKPAIRSSEIKDWKQAMQTIAQHENVHCKISGMVTEANRATWKKEDFIPYLDAVVSAFGIDRIMYGSDWPVCLVAASYEEMVAIVRDYFLSFTKREQEKVFGINAIEFYRL